MDSIEVAPEVMFEGFKGRGGGRGGTAQRAGSTRRGSARGGAASATGGVSQRARRTNRGRATRRPQRVAGTNRRRG